MERHRAAPAGADRSRTSRAAAHTFRGSQRFASGFATDRAWKVRGAHPLQGRLNTLPPRDLPCLHQIRLSTPVAALTARADSRAARNSDGFFFSAALQVQLTESYYEAD